MGCGSSKAGDVAALRAAQQAEENADLKAMVKQLLAAQNQPTVQDAALVTTRVVVDLDAFLDAAAAGKGNDVRSMLDEQVDANHVRASDGASALFLASTNGHESVVRMLIDAGANLDHRTDGNGKCALLKASVRGHTRVVKLLLDAGANVNTLKTYDAASSLYAAAYAGKVEAMELLIQHNAHLENRMVENSLVTIERDPKFYGSTPLIIASFFDQADAVKVLIKAGADTSATTVEGKTALDVAGSEACRRQLTAATTTGAAADEDRRGEEEGRRLFNTLSAHIAAALGLAPVHPAVTGYAVALNAEGCYTPEEFDDLSCEELKEAPFCFKRLDLKKVGRSREKRQGTRDRDRATTPDAGSMRGQCSQCGKNVYDSQPRFKDPQTGKYHHENCAADPAPPLEGISRTSMVVSQQAIPDAHQDAAQIADAEVARAESEAARTDDSLPAPQPPLSVSTTTNPANPVLLAGPKTRALLPDGKHAFLSYQWDVQDQVKKIKELLNDRNVKCWMDIDGGMKSDIYDSMAEGVQGAACLLCFMTQAYQDSANCKLELKFAQQSGVPIIPVMMQPNFVAKGWLGILTSGSIWTPMYESASVLDGIDKLIEQAQHLVPGMRMEDEASDTASEVSENTESFDVGAWGDAMFSLDEMREELERLRDDGASSSGSTPKSATDANDVLMCKLPAMVPTLPRGLYVTSAMQSVLDAVLSETSTSQIGFCGMGGIGKTTVSCWVTRGDAVRTKFGMVAWITLGQTPVLDSCIDLLHQQLTGSSLPDGISADQKHEFLQEAFRSRSVLLVLDDCWDADVAKHFIWVDPKTNSKVLISSRVRDVLDGGDIINVTIPSKSDAVKMLLSTAGMDVEALHRRMEVAYVAELCKRLPLTIGVAGKLIRQLAQGSSMSEASDWTDVVALLEDEMNDPDGSLSVEESVIRASIKAIPKKIQKQVTQLFHGFALAPEDTLVPLPVVGMIFDACGELDDGESLAKPLSRLQVRRYLKALIDRSLVLGTVDRPQLHDVMLDYVQKQLSGEPFKAAQRRLVDALRESDRSTSTVTGEYIQQCVQHHITCSHDAAWERSRQATDWLEDHDHGCQDLIAASVASILPAEVLAKEAEAAEMWWQAALRWNAVGLMKKIELGSHNAAIQYFKRAVSASTNAGAALATDNGSGGDVAQLDLDVFDLYALNFVMKSFDPAMLSEYGERYQHVLSTETGRSRPLMLYAGVMTMEWFAALLQCTDLQKFTDVNWKMSQIILDLFDESTEAHALSTEEDRKKAKPLLAWTLFIAGDTIAHSPGFSWELFGDNGDKLVEHQLAYTYEEHHSFIVDLLSNDAVVNFGGAPFILALQFGRIADAKKLAADSRIVMERAAKSQDAGSMLALYLGICFLTRMYYFLGMPQQAQACFDVYGITFDTAEEILISVASKNGALGILFTRLDHKGSGGGTHSTPRYVMHVKSMFILHTDVPKAKAIAWLESLPSNEDFIACSMTTPSCDHAATFGSYQSCWIALAHEKVGMYDGALRFADLQMEPDMMRAGTPKQKWSQVIALACKGRVLSKLNKHGEALAAFQEAITTSKESYSMMEAFAYRELANYAGGGDAAVHAGGDLEAKLKTFEGRMTRTEFAALKIGP